MTIRQFTIAILLVISVCLVEVHVRAQTAPCLIRFKYHVGDVYVYKGSQDTSIEYDKGDDLPAGTFGKGQRTVVTHADVTQTSTVTGIRGVDGAAEITSATTFQDAVRNGKDFAAMANSVAQNQPNIAVYMDNRGSLVGTEKPWPADSWEGTHPGTTWSGPNFSLIGCLLPPNPVKPGDFWTDSINLTGPNVKSQATVVSITKSPAGMIAHLILRAEGPKTVPTAIGFPPLTGTEKTTIDTFFNIDTGQVQSSTCYTETRVSGTTPDLAAMKFDVHEVGKLQNTLVTGQ